MKRCDCPSCRERDNRTCEATCAAIVGASFTYDEWRELTVLSDRVATCTGPQPSALAERVGKYGFPPIPKWDGEPREYGQGGT